MHRNENVQSFPSLTELWLFALLSGELLTHIML